MGDLLRALFLFVWPPNTGVKEQNRWMQAITLVVLGIAAGEGTHIALACGYLPSLFPGFATNDAVASLGAKIGRLEASGLRSTMLTLRIKQCERMAAREHDDMRAGIATQMQDLMDQYQQATGRAYSPIACQDL